MDLVKSEIEKAIKQANPVVVESKRAVYKDKVKFIDVSAVEYVEFEMMVRDAWKAKATLSRTRPTAYILDADQIGLVKKMKTLGIEVEKLQEERNFEVETYHVKTYYQKPVRYEKMKLQTVETELKKEKKTFKAGTFMVKMNQRRANLVPELLEPEAPNSFVNFGLIETEKGKTLPIYRLHN